MFKSKELNLSFFEDSITSENVAERFGISRQQQDEFALESQKRLVLSAEVIQLSSPYLTQILVLSAELFRLRSYLTQRLVLSAELFSLSSPYLTQRLVLSAELFSLS